jgi:hypothetical protein
MLAEWLIDEAGSNGWWRNVAAVSLGYEAVAVTRDEVVDRIAEKARHDASDNRETPRSAEVAGNPQACV